ncbi:MAG: alanyl-tRNA synthetase, partial [Trebouxia sp. A1-2]
VEDEPMPDAQPKESPNLHQAHAPPKLGGAEIRERFLEFYEQHQHVRLPSSSLIPDDPTVLLTIAGMLQFKAIFMGQAQRKHSRATTTQKCIRTNDLENVGVTARHHSFFEMLGNFSFGDYFKPDAISMAWELSTKVFQLPPERIWVSVYEQDDEAYALWRDQVKVPESRIIRMGAADNFWAAGATGHNPLPVWPCGGCSELYYDFFPEQGTAGADLEDDSRQALFFPSWFIEYYNLVFMENNRDADGNLTPLARKNIDTGLGLERMAQILQKVPNNYETDLILPIVARAAQLADLHYESASAADKTYLKVIGDHVRACVYLISDGVFPSNVGRGYILRRLIRRSLLKARMAMHYLHCRLGHKCCHYCFQGHLLGIKGTFLSAVAQVAIDLSEGCDPAVKKNAPRILKELQLEEERFSSTLGTGQKLLTDILQQAAAKQSNGANGSKPSVSGRDAFVLYDTYGFPLEITQELASAQGVTVDLEGFTQEMQIQKQRSKDASKQVDMTASDSLREQLRQIRATQFQGYEDVQGVGAVVAILQHGQMVPSAHEDNTDEHDAGDEVDIILDQTPFYAESGGQVGDQGFLRAVATAESSSAASTSSSACEALVSDVQKMAGDFFAHRARVTAGEVTVGQQMSASVDEGLRRRARGHHTATHLLQAALKTVLGDHITQQGSLVTTQRLRFDFNLPRGMSGEEVRKVEELVNSWIQQDHSLATHVVPLQEAKDKGAVFMAGEQYGDEVRVIDIPGVSMELCGGTHVTRTGQIGAFKILSEGGIASGVRRVEAVAGPAAVDHMNTLDSIVRAIGQQLKAKNEELPGRVTGEFFACLMKELQAAQKQISDLRTEVAQAQLPLLITKAETLPSGARLLAAQVDGMDAKSLQACWVQEAASQMQASLGDPAAVFLIASPDSQKVSMAAAFSPLVVSQGLQAGKFVGSVAKICGGGGGGRPNLAQAGGKDASKMSEALQTAKQQLQEKL